MKIKKLLIILASIAAQPIVAAVLNKSDMDFVFNDSTSGEIASLSTQAMINTKGAADLSKGLLQIILDGGFSLLLPVN